MSFNGSGTFVVNSAGQPVVANTVISATVFNALTADLATGLSTCITKDGQTTVTANIPFGNNKITALGAGTAASDAANLGQVQSTAAKLVTVTGTDTITGTMSPALTAYAAGQLFYFIANAANTGAVTINIDGLGAKSITRDGSTALAAGDINSGEFVVIIYDGTRFQMINAANSFGNTTINGTLTVTGNTALQANVSITSTLSVGGTFAVTGAATLGSTLAVTGKSDLPTVSTASINAAVALITTGTVTNLTASGASIASANIGNLQFTAASIASINAGVAVVTNLTATSASIASMNAGVALLTTATVTGLTVTGASIASVNAGTATLSGNLTLNGGTANGVLYLNGSKVATSGSALTFDGNGAVISVNSSSDAMRITQVGAGNALLVEDSANPDASPTVIDATGAVGIGTASPDRKLHIYTVDATGKMALFQNGNTNTNLYLSSDPTSGGGVINVSNNAASAALPLLFQGNGTERMRLDASGNLGIGTTSPAGKLTVKTGTNENLTVLTGGSGDMRLSALNDAASATVQLSIQGSPLYFRGVGGAINATLDSSGNLGLGVTPSAWNTGALQIRNASFWGLSGSPTFSSVGANYYYDGTYKYISTAQASDYYQFLGQHVWRTAASGTAGNAITFTSAMTLDASGNLGIGTTSPSGRLQVRASTPTVYVTSDDTGQGHIYFGGTTDSDAGRITYSDNADAMWFSTDNTERARITAGGYFKASNDGVYANSTGTFHELRNTANDHAVVIANTNASLTTAGVAFIQASRNTTDNTFYALTYYNAGADLYRFRVADSGNVTNTNGSYGTISDAKMKTDIVDASSQWDDLKAVRFRKFKMKDDPTGLVQLGVVAQELEQTSPGLVDEHADLDAEGNDLGTTTKSVKTSVLLMKAAVALQEAMARIEQLEAKVAALEAR